MLVKDMFTKEFYEEYGDIDVYDDVCEELGVAFCGSLLTDEGKERFAMVLYDEVEINDGVAVVLLDCMAEGKWQKHLRMLKDLFYGVAGYCAEDDWNRWFKDLPNTAVVNINGRDREVTYDIEGPLMDKAGFVHHELAQMLRATGIGVEGTEFLVTTDGEEFVRIHYEGGGHKDACVTADSKSALVKDVMKVAI